VRALTTTYEVEKNIKVGAAPTWIVKFTVDGVTYYLSDNAYTITPWAVTTKPWVSGWGELSQGASGGIGDYQISTFSVSCLIDTDATPNIDDLASGNIEGESVEIYSWFHGLTDAPLLMFTGFIRDTEQSSETSINMTFEDESVKFERDNFGTIATQATYPQIDVDDIGKIEPVVFGTVNRIPAIGAVVGARTSLLANISITQTTITISDSSAFSVGDQFSVDSEDFYITSVVNGTTITVTRGYNATGAITHGLGSPVLQILNQFIYLLAGEPVDSINSIFAIVNDIEMNVISISTVYTGNAGNQLAGYEGKAVAVVSGFITVEQFIDLLLVNDLDVDDQTTVDDELEIKDNIEILEPVGGHKHADAVGITIIVPLDDVTHSAYHSWDRAIDGDLSTYVYVNEASGDPDTGPILFKRVRPFYLQGRTAMRRFAMKYQDWNSNLKYRDGEYGTALNPGTGSGVVYTNWTSLSSWAAITNVSAPKFVIESSSTAAVFGCTHEIWMEVFYYPETVSDSAQITRSSGPGKEVTREFGVTKGGEVIFNNTINIAGNSTSNTSVARSVFAGMTRATTISSAISTVLGGATVTIDGPMPASYALNGAITQSKTALEWANLMCFQLRSYLRFYNGAAQVFVRPGTPANDKTIEVCKIDDTGRLEWSRVKTNRDDVINKITLHYDKDWASTTGTPYQQIAEAEDVTSQGKFGVCERVELFSFDFVTNTVMAESLRDFYLAYYKDRKWKHSFTTFLDNIELDFQDVVTLNFRNSEVLTIKESKFSPGDIDTIDTITFIAEG